jgi:thymidylate synthase (FAD)
MNPRAYLLGRPQFDGAYQEFLDAFLPAGKAFWTESSTATPTERLVEFAGRVCYMSFGPRQSKKTTVEYIHNLIRNGHDSVLEHATWTIALLGVSRAFTHQLVRHRVGFAFSQLSQQYHDESDARFVRPEGIDKVPEAAAAWDKAMRDSQTTYRKILKTLAAADRAAPSVELREATRALRAAARSVLPNATETAILITANARALRHFFKVRGSIIGDAEMRCVAATLLQLVGPEAPALFSDFSIEYPADGIPLVVHCPVKQ